MVTIGEAFTPTDGIIFSATDVKLKIGDSLIPSPGSLHLTVGSVFGTGSSPSLLPS